VSHEDFEAEEWYITLEDAMDHASHPGQVVAALLHEVAGCHSVIKAYSKLLFENVNIDEIEQRTGITLQASIVQSCDRLRNLGTVMHGYRRTYAVAHADLRAEAESNDWLSVLDEVIDLSEQEPSAAIARFSRDAAVCWTVIDQCSTIVFENAAIDIVDTALPIRQAIGQRCHYLQHLIGVMDAYRQTLIP
jgi:hypothetical protein